MLNIEKKIEPLERVEFAFVLLPDDTTLRKLLTLSQTIYALLQDLPLRRDIPHHWGNYLNKPLILPHLSIGQYGLLGDDIDQLHEIIKNVATSTTIIYQKMNNKLSIIDGYIFFDAQNVFSTVDIHIKNMYINLRKLYMRHIQTKFPIAQMVFTKKTIANNEQELTLIDKHFQNWGTPEYDRMRPHVTLHYHPPFQQEDMTKILKFNVDITKQIETLSTIAFTRLAAIRIDTFGNPIEDKALCLHSLNRL